MKCKILNESLSFLLFAVLLTSEAFALDFTATNSTFDTGSNGYSWAVSYNRKIQTNMDPLTGTMLGSVYRKLHTTAGSGVLGGTIGSWESMFLGNSEYLYTESQFQGGAGEQTGNPGVRNMYASEFINGYFFVLFSDLDTSSGYAFSQPMFTVCDARYGWDDVSWSIPKRIESSDGVINTSAWYATGDVAYNPVDGYYYWTTTWQKNYNVHKHFIIVGRSNTPADPESWKWTNYNELVFDPANPKVKFSTFGNIKPAYAKDIYGNGNGFAIAVVPYVDATYHMNNLAGEPVETTNFARLGYIYTTNWGADWSTGDFKSNWNTLRNEGNNFIPANTFELFDWYNTPAPEDSIGVDFEGNPIYREVPLNWPFYSHWADVICTENNIVHVILKVRGSTTEVNQRKIDINYVKVVSGYYDIIGEITETGVVWKSANYIASYMGIDDWLYEGKSFISNVLGYAGNGVIYASWWDRPETRYQPMPSSYDMANTWYLDDAYFTYSPDNGETWSLKKTVTIPNEFQPETPYQLKYAYNLTNSAGMHESGWSVASHGTNISSGTNDGVLTVYAASQYNDEANPIASPQTSFDDFQQFLKVWKITGSGTGIEAEQVSMIKDFELFQNYPNPFNPSTEIRFNLQSDSKVKLSVFNTKGEVVADLMNKKMLKGTHSVNFDASALNSGVYFYKLDVNGRAETKKMVLAR